ncbi:zinc-dependent alcohol dehydrogenase [Rhodopila sp.]|jgi:(R,R)-butanediol dehydrogenase/meso-butanediol dehydrogenase/diacetyl reductase|uniref:zinc-dependent alcohol dehydrogenase n=1 Tax=Rhodopila sp. TaxID=2480087 RepID=UPI002B745813|nr:zinc-binding dehydrogenase [Rhodopila sp.]HVZ06944.1 zinc-binding dehydrogenase [Rhodopila sp.]
MRSLVFAEPGQPLRPEDRPVPEPEPGDLIVKVAYCGICGSDVHATDPGPFQIAAGTVLGHEFSGEVVDSRADGFVAGDRVIGIPVRPCDPCRAESGECRDGMGIRCPNARVIGMSPGIPGGYAEFVRIGARQVLKVPDGVGDKAAALVEPLAVGAHAVRAAGPLLGRRVLVIGAGPIGNATALFARAAGARDVVVSELDPTRRARARRLGATAVADPAAEPLDQAFAGLTGGPPEVIFECVGAAGLIQHCIELAAPTGTIVIVGVCRVEDRMFPRRAITKELRLQFVLGYVPDDFALALDLLRSGRFDADAMVSDVVSFAELPTLFEALRRPNPHGKVLLDPTRQ